MRLHDWTGFATLAAILHTIGCVLFANWTAAWVGLGFAVVLGALTRYWSVTEPGPMPYMLRWTLAFPRGNLSPEHLARLLEPRRGERMLEVGPGTGIYSVPIAQALGHEGALDVIDVQQEMLDEVTAHARAAGVANVTATRGDARTLPYPDAAFDAAYLVGVLGEIPDESAALRELRRVLKPSGRLVVGEVAIDPDFVRLGPLRERTRAARFELERRQGNVFSYLARFRAV
jgi:ubiquinone/menaquinone biosynthesis C-methylase UbiE